MPHKTREDYDTNRFVSRNPFKKNGEYCPRCDKVMIKKGEKCPVCGLTYLPKKYKKTV